MVCLYLLSVLLVVVTVANGRNLCPVTSVMDLKNNTNYLYPLELYPPDDVMQEFLDKGNVFPCYSDYKYLRWYEFHCSSDRFCPVTWQNVQEATAKKYHKSSSLCHLKEKLGNKKEKVNVFVFGGSVTGGSMSDGCTVGEMLIARHMVKRCAWPYHFGEWLKQVSVATVNMYNLAEGGQDTYVRSRTMFDSLEEVNVTSFTGNDLIFLDHSVNEGGMGLRIEKGLESMIRRIYALSNPSSWPAIVVIDGQPRDATHPPRAYLPGYETVVRYYNLSMWSYTDAVLSKYVDELQSKFADPIRFNSSYLLNVHPPWHVHLFIADLYSAIFMAEMDHCTPPTIQLAKNIHFSPLKLPPPLSACDEGPECDKMHPALLSISYKEILNNKLIGSYVTDPPDSWKVGEDVPGRGGIIVELVNGQYEYGTNDPATITFVLPQTTEELMEKFTQLHIEGLNLRTYENAGKVTISVCGQKRFHANGLWNDFRTNQISVPDLFEQSFDLSLCKRKYEYPTITFIHTVVPRSDRTFRVRGNQKFKIISIKVYGVV